MEKKPPLGVVELKGEPKTREAPSRKAATEDANIKQVSQSEQRKRFES